MPKIDLPHLAATLFGTPHLVRRGKFDAILNAVAPRILDGGKLPFLAFDQDDEALENAPDVQYQVRRGVAVIPVIGTLVRRGSWVDALSGLTSYDELRACIRAAMRDPDVRGVLLDIDSHGGEAGGVFDLADYIAQVREKTGKPIWAHANECAASAAYVIACATDEVWIARTGEVGSIGVVCAHLDQSKADEKAGLKWTFIYEGERKLDGNPHAPLPDDVAERVQDSARELYDMFVALVAQNRGMTGEKVRDTKAEMFRGQKAVDAGLADRVGTFDQALSALARSVDKPSTGRSGKGEMNVRGSKWHANLQPKTAIARSDPTKTLRKTKSPRARKPTKTMSTPRVKTRT